MIYMPNTLGIHGWFLLRLRVLFRGTRLGRIASGSRAFPFQFVLALGVMIHIRLGAKLSGAKGAGVQLDARVCGKMFLAELNGNTWTSVIMHIDWHSSALLTSR